MYPHHHPADSGAEWKLHLCIAVSERMAKSVPSRDLVIDDDRIDAGSHGIGKCDNHGVPPVTCDIDIEEQREAGSGSRGDRIGNATDIHG